MFAPGPARPVVYSFEDIIFLNQILDDAVRSLPPALQTTSARAAIGQRILACAATGERNRVELRIAGLADLADKGSFAA